MRRRVAEQDRAAAPPQQGVQPVSLQVKLAPEGDVGALHHVPGTGHGGHTHPDTHGCHRASWPARGGKQQLVVLVLVLQVERQDEDNKTKSLQMHEKIFYLFYFSVCICKLMFIDINYTEAI